MLVSARSKATTTTTNNWNKIWANEFYKRIWIWIWIRRTSKMFKLIFDIFSSSPFNHDCAIWCASADDADVNHVPRNVFTFRNSIYTLKFVDSSCIKWVFFLRVIDFSMDFSHQNSLAREIVEEKKGKICKIGFSYM